MTDAPLLTMTKSRFTGPLPEFTKESEELLTTLSSLCSFYSCEDLASFLFTKMFRNLVGFDEPWIVFEVGIYANHTKTIEIIPVHDGIMFVDGKISGIIEGNITVVKTEEECSTILSDWENMS